jgi:hypothetical protein
MTGLQDKISYRNFTSIASFLRVPPERTGRERNLAVPRLLRGLDPNGDRLVNDIASDGKFPADAKSSSGKATITTGTEKYAGISDGRTFTCHLPEFRTAVEGTFANYCVNSGSFRIP